MKNWLAARQFYGVVIVTINNLCYVNEKLARCETVLRTRDTDYETPIVF